MAILILFLGFFLLVFAILFLAVAFDRKRRKKLKELSEVFSGKINLSFYDLTFEGSFQGIKFVLVLVPESKNSSKSLKITLFKNCYVPFKISFESFFTSLGKKLGFLHEVRINDPMFDKTFFVSSKTPEAASGHLNNENVKLTIGELFMNGFDSLSIDGKKVFTKKDDYDLENDLNPEYIKGILQKLNSIAK